MKTLIAVLAMAMIAMVAVPVNAAENSTYSPMPTDPEDVIDAAMAKEAATAEKPNETPKKVSKKVRKKPTGGKSKSVAKKVRKKPKDAAPKYDRYKY
jgi:hypothetical protein